MFSNRRLICLALAALLVTACNSATPPPEAVSQQPATVETTPEPTAALPTASAPTATPTQGPPTATPTRVVQPTATPSPQPTPTPHIHIIEQYDTLFGIALEYGVTVDALSAANGVTEDDFLQIGQELIIPAPNADVTASEASSGVGEQGGAPPTAAGEQASAGETTTSGASPQTTAGGETAANNPAVQTDTDTAEAAPAPTPPAPANPPPDVNISRAANINPLTGLPVNDPALLQRRPLLVRIGNDVGARQSQAGLNSAEIVYEEITEWWVTRFTAIYLAETPNTVAPIRSARLINVQLTPQYQGALAHSGGSDPVRWEISQAPIVDLDEFYNASPYYYRPNQGWQTRLAIDTEAARNYMVNQGTEAPVALHGFLFSNTIAKGEPAENIYIPYPRATTFTQWSYDAASGKYRRWANGQPLYDANGLGQVSASNVIIYFAPHQETDIVEDSNGATAIRIQVNGQGPAWFFRDGKLNKGFWQTDGARTPYFGYEDGSPYKLKPGNTWVEVVPTYFTIGLDSPDEASASP